jgi:hypothetical protein
MHDPEERPCFRWRKLGWVIVAFILAPVLYVAASGPLAWWRTSQYRSPMWYSHYKWSLRPFSEIPVIDSTLRAYRAWWVGMPAPRSWRRQYLADQLAEQRKIAEELRAARAWLDAQADALRARLQVLESAAIYTEGVPVEAIDIRLRLEKLGGARGRIGSQLPPSNLPQLPWYEARVLEAEAALRQFDAR